MSRKKDMELFECDCDFKGETNDPRILAIWSLIHQNHDYFVTIGRKI